MNRKLRTKLKALLKEEEKEIRRARKQKEENISLLWKYVLPSKLEGLVMKLHEESMLTKLQDALSDGDRTRIWDNISDFNLTRILYENSLADQERILLQISSERMKWYLNSTDCCHDIVFDAVNISYKIEMLKMFYNSNLKIVFESNWGLLQRLLECIADERVNTYDQDEIFQKIAQLLAANTLANAMEKGSASVLYNLLKWLEPEKIEEICEEIQAENLFNVLEKCDYRIINSTVIQRLPEEERGKVFTFLRNQEMTNRLSTEDIIESIYPNVSLENKESILYDILLKEEIVTLYKTLSEADQREMLLIMLGEKGTCQYDLGERELMRENVVFILKKKEKEDGLDYIEEVVLRDVSAE